MRQFSFLLFFIFFVNSVFAEAKTDTRISGLITNRLSDNIEVSFPDNFITFKEKRFPIKLDQDGFFEVTFYFEGPREVELKHGNRNYRIFLDPGDNLFLKLDTRMVNSIPVFEGQGASNNNYLAIYQKQFSKYSDAWIRSKMASLSHREFTFFMQNIRKEKLDFFSANNIGITNSFYAHAMADVDYWWAYQMLQYRWEHPTEAEGSFPLILPDSYYSFLDELEINWDPAMTNANYVYFISEFLSFDEERSRHSNPVEFSKRPYKNARMFLSGKPLAYMMANEMYLMLKRKQHHLYKSEIKTFIRDTPYEGYRQVVKDAFEDTQRIKAGQLAPDFSVIDKNGKIVKLSDFRGKVVYLDFWATWCPPCLIEIPYSQQLNRTFSSEDVAFLYISLDVNSYNWRQYLENNQMSGHHFFAEGVYESKVAMTYFLKALPNFILIDQEGVVIKNPASRPSQEGVRAEIQSLLNNRW